MRLVPALLLLAGALAPVDSPSLAPELYECTPASVTIGGRTEQTKHPIARALTAAKAGDTILLRPGNYEPFTIGFDNNSPSNARTSGGRPGAPIVVSGDELGLVRIRTRGGDTIAIDQRLPNGHITFKNLTIEAGPRAAIMFFRQPPAKIHAGFAFEDCHIDGGWNHLKKQGRKSKWGVWGQNLKDFRFVGTKEPARIHGLRYEHAFYLQNSRGDILIENVQANLLGRTFCQFTARERDGLPGEGTITIKNCRVFDAGIAREDGFKGGSAFTLAGRHRGTFLLEGNLYRAGFHPDVRELTLPLMPYGTGAVAIWQGGEREQNAHVILRDNVFEYYEGCGDRPVVAIGGTARVEISGTNRFLSGGSQPALALDPVNDAGRPISPLNKSVSVDPATVFGGAIVWGEDTLAPRELAERLEARAKERASAAAPSDG